jgi:hypothetical protein
MPSNQLQIRRQTTPTLTLQIKEVKMLIDELEEIETTHTALEIRIGLQMR